MSDPQQAYQMMQNRIGQQEPCYRTSKWPQRHSLCTECQTRLYFTNRTLNTSKEMLMRDILALAVLVKRVREEN